MQGLFYTFEHALDVSYDAEAVISLGRVGDYYRLNKSSESEFLEENTMTNQLIGAIVMVVILCLLLVQTPERK